MAGKTQIIDFNGSKIGADVRKKNGEKGLVVLTEPLFDNFTEINPLLNDTFGSDMNQNVTFGGTPELIFDGGSGGTQWDSTALQGSWNFADSGKVTITTADNNDEAQWDDSSGGSIDMNDYTAITGKVDLDVYSSLNNSIIVEFSLAGVLQGNSVDLNDYIDTGSLAEQSFVIPKEDLGITGSTVDQMNITITRSGGVKPTIKFDDFQIEETGNPEVFKFQPTGEIKYKLTEVNICMADNVTTANAQDYNALMGVSALANGISVRAVSDRETVFTGSFSRLIDFLQIATAKFTVGGDGTNSWITISYDFADFPVILKDTVEDGVFFTINDDLSGLLFFRVFIKVVRIIENE